MEKSRTRSVYSTVSHRWTQPMVLAVGEQANTDCPAEYWPRGDFESANETLKYLKCTYSLWIRVLESEQTPTQDCANMQHDNVEPRTRREYENSIQAALSDVSESDDRVRTLSLGRSKTERTALRRLTADVSQSDIAAVAHL